MLRFWPLVLLLGCEGAIVGGELPAVPRPVQPDAKPRVDCSGRHPAVTVLHRLTATQYRNAIADIFNGKVRPSTSWPAPVTAPVTGFSTEEPTNQIGEQGATQLIRAGDDIALGLVPVLPELLSCARSAPGQACFDSFLAIYARRAFRRMITAEERATLQAVYDAAITEGADFTDAVAIVTSTLMQSPQFLYVVEDAAGSGRAVSSIELASRLSFLFWDSVPDDELLTVAQNGQLQDPAVLAAQARRLLESPRADPAIARYFREWTDSKRLLATDKDPATFPFFDTRYTQSLDESFDRFVIHQVRSGGTLETLLTSNEAFVDDRLAASYGVPAPTPGAWLKVTVDAERYSGLLTHPLLLASQSHAAEPSFIFRGRTIQKRLLCTPMAAAPADALAAFAATPRPPNPTARQTGDIINSTPACSGCHRVLNPPGLALEHFDAVGRYRETDTRGRAIETAGELVGVSPEPLPFTTPKSLATLMASRPEAMNCLSENLFRFTFSRLDTEADACAIQTLDDALSASGGTLSQGLLALTTTEAFTWRADP